MKALTNVNPDVFKTNITDFQGCFFSLIMNSAVICHESTQLFVLCAQAINFWGMTRYISQMPLSIDSCYPKGVKWGTILGSGFKSLGSSFYGGGKKSKWWQRGGGEREKNMTETKLAFFAQIHCFWLKNLTSTFTHFTYWLVFILCQFQVNTFPTYFLCKF